MKGIEKRAKIQAVFQECFGEDVSFVYAACVELQKNDIIDGVVGEDEAVMGCSIHSHAKDEELDAMIGALNQMHDQSKEKRKKKDDFIQSLSQILSEIEEKLFEDDDSPCDCKRCTQRREKQASEAVKH